MIRRLHAITWVLMLSGITGCTNDPSLEARDRTPTISGEVEVEDENGETSSQVDDPRNVEPPGESEPHENAEDEIPWSFSSGSEIESGIRLDVEETEKGEIELVITAVQLENVFGIAFHLNFNPNVIEFLSGTSTDVLRDNTNDATSVVRTETGSIRFGTARIPPPPQFGGGQNLTGMNLDGAVIARFQMGRVAPGKAQLEMPMHHRDLRNTQLETIQFELQSGDLTLQEKGGAL